MRTYRRTIDARRARVIVFRQQLPLLYHHRFYPITGGKYWTHVRNVLLLGFGHDLLRLLTDWTDRLVGHPLPPWRSQA